MHPVTSQGGGASAALAWWLADYLAACTRYMAGWEESIRAVVVEELVEEVE